MESSSPLSSLSSFVHQRFCRLRSVLSTGVTDALSRSKFSNGLSDVPNRSVLSNGVTDVLSRSMSSVGISNVLTRSMSEMTIPRTLLASVSLPQVPQVPVKRDRISMDHVSRALAGTSLYTLSNADNEFILISDSNGYKSIGLLCFRQEDAEAFLAQARFRKRELRCAAKVVPISLQQVYMLKVEGIAFRFLPDPLQIRHALEASAVLSFISPNQLNCCKQLKTSHIRTGFDGVPVFQSELLVVKKKNKRYCPIYFQKEDIERELLKFPKSSRSPLSKHIMVGSLEDVLKRIEMSEKNSGWEDLVFIPPGKCYSDHIEEVFDAR